MSSPHAVQIIARDQIEVAPKINELLTTYDVTVSEIIDFKVVSFGANQFLITLMYQDIATVRALSALYGLKAVVSRAIEVARGFSGKVGAVASVLALHGAPLLAPKAGLKVIVATYQAVYNKFLSVTTGLKASLARAIATGRSKNAKTGLVLYSTATWYDTSLNEYHDYVL